MADLGATLEEVQVQVLQGDLSTNPGLQPSTIPTRDKELKTNAKKIIPAINELLKQIGVLNNTVTDYSGNMQALIDAAQTNFSENVQHAIEGMEGSVDDKVNAAITTVVQEQINDYVKSLMAEQLNTMMSDYVETTIKPYIDEQLSNAATGEGGSTLKRQFNSKAVLARNATCKLPWKFSEIQDIDKQVSATNYSEQSRGQVFMPVIFKPMSSSTSNYATYTYPIDVRVDAETDEVTLVNGGLYAITLYFFDLV